MEGPCKVRSETETKRNKTKQIETKRNKSKRNETNRNETKRNKTNRNETKQMILASNYGQKSLFSNIRISCLILESIFFNLGNLFSNIRQLLNF